MNMAFPWKLLRTLLCAERRCSACSSVFAPAQDTVAGCRPGVEENEALASLAVGRHFCPDCRSRMHMRKQGYCPLCGELAAWKEQPAMPCGRCLEKRPPWTEAVFWGAHEDLLRDLLLRLKFLKELPLAHALGAVLAAHPRLQSVEADIIVPIPLHSVSLRQRGFNQSLELARPIAGRLRLPLDANSLVKTRATEPQHSLPREGRQLNVRQAFTASQAIRGKKILLVDDTMTTGATMHAAASALLRAGAANVRVAVVSRTAAVFDGK